MDITVIGAGPGGYVAAIKAAINGANVTVIEKDQVGGTCLNWGCIPTKSLLAASDRIDMIRDAGEFGIDIDQDFEVDFNKIISRKDKIVKTLVGGIEQLFKGKNIKLIRGTAKIVSKNEIKVIYADNSEDTINADKIILATGSSPIIPPIFPYDGKTVITSDEAVNLDHLPKSMIIVGGGVIGCEFGQFFQKLGCTVTIVEMADHVLPFEDDDIAKLLNRAFKKDKLKTMTNDSITSVEASGSMVKAELGSGKTIEAEMMLVAVGRKSNTADLGLEELGIRMDRGKIETDENMQTNIEGIYAIGDIINTPMLAHVASREGIVAADHAAGKISAINYEAVPRCVYTDPEVACVGKTEKELDKKEIQYKTGTFDFRALGKAQAIGSFQGMVKVICDADDTIIGASIIGPHATDLLTELTLAVHMKLTSAQLGEVIHPHPTLSEALMEAVHDVHKECIHKI